MNKIGLWFVVLFMVISGAQATVVDPTLLPISIDLHNKPKLQRGAKLFMNYCSGCHSLRYIRYNVMARDIGLTTFDGSVDSDLLTNNLIFTGAKIHDPIQISMPEVDSRQWFGMPPPDLSLVARERGANWLFTYLKSFYIDKKRPFGSNNLLFPDVGMPNVLAPLQGQIIIQHQGDRLASPSNARLLLVDAGEMTEQQFDSAMQDLVTFLVYVGEPAKLVRYQIGLVVLIFLGILSGVAYQLKKFYWRNIR